MGKFKWLIVTSRSQIWFAMFCSLFVHALAEWHHDSKEEFTTPSTEVDANTQILSSVSPDATVPNQPALECISTSDKLFKFILTTHRNSTGHWIADMDLQHEGTEATDEHPFEVQLEHMTSACITCEDPGPIYARVYVHEPPPTRVPSAGGYRYFPGFGFYKRHLTLLDWRAARDVCRGEGADLVVINSEAEAKLLLELSAPLLFLKPAEEWNAEAYVGIYDFHHEGHFTTVTGQPLEESGYEQWSDLEPNNFKEEDCVTIVRNAMYNDVKCSKLFEFICEIPEH